MKRILLLVILLGVAFVGLVAAAQLDFGPLVITREGEQKIIFRFNEAWKVTQPGWALRTGIPAIERVENGQEPDPAETLGEAGGTDKAPGIGDDA